MKSKEEHLSGRDKNLIEAIQIFEKEWISTYLDELELAGKFTYSKRHIKRMNRMLNHHDSLFYRATCTSKRQIAAAIIAIIIGFNTVMITSVEAREFVHNFVIEVYEEFSNVIFSNDSAASEIVDCYEPSYVPAGYSVDVVEKGNKAIYIDYINEDGEIISFEQAIINESELGIDTENSEVEIVVVNQTEGFIVFNKDCYSLHWSDSEYRYNLIGIEKDEIIKMAESLKIISGGVLW